MMRAITIRQPWLWAICRGQKDVENRANRKGQAAAKAQFNHPGPVLLHASSKWEGSAAYDRVRSLSPVDPGLSGSPGSDTAWYGDGGFVGLARLASVHLADECYDPFNDRLCSPWADPNSAHLVLTDVQVLHRPVPCPGQLGLWKVEDTHLLAEIRRQTA